MSSFYAFGLLEAYLIRVDLSARRADPIFWGVYRLPESAIAPQAREENARSASIGTTLALKANGALPRAIAILIVGNDAEKAVRFVGDPSREKDSLVESRQEIP